MSNIDKRALREELSNPAIGSNVHLRKLALALLDELEAEERISSTWRKTAESNREKLEAVEKRIADQSGIIESARKFISEYAGLGDVGAAEFVKIIDRAAAAGKGE